MMTIKKLSTAGRAALAVGMLGLPLVMTPVASAVAPEDGEAPVVPGLVVYASDYDVPETVQRVEDALNEAGMVTAVLDHQANAESVGSELRPTTLVIGGAPQAGTPLLLEEQEVGIDLPQKYLSWQDGAGDVWLAHNSAEYIAAQAGIDTASGAATGLAEGSAGVAAGASGSDAPASEGDVEAGYEDYLVQQRSDVTVEEAIARYQAAFVEAGLAPLTTVDHQGGAQSIGEDLRPTQVTYVGNPQLGTPLIAAQQTIGIDLPARYLAWQEEDGTVNVAHVDINVLAQRHGVSGVDDVLAMVEMGTGNFTAAAAGSAPQVTMPEGGVATGGGGTAGFEHGGPLALGVLSLLGAAALALRALASGRGRA